MNPKDALAQLDREIDRAQAFMAWERAAPRAAAAIGLACLWAAAALFGLLEAVPPLAASLLSVAVLAAFLGLIGWAAASWRRPAEAAARQRLAHDAKIDPAILDALGDQPAKLDSFALALWRREQARAFEAARRVAARPRALAVADPWRLRYVAAGALIAGLIFAGAAIPDRLAAAFLPDPGPLLGDAPMQIEAWAAPASYVGAAPISLSERVGARIETPPSVEATVRVTGPKGPPVLAFNGAKGDRRVKFRRAADGAYEAKLALPGEGVLRVVRFHTKARWRLVPGADRAPSATFLAAPRVEKGRLLFTWAAKDDYGVRSIRIRATPVDPPPGLKDAEPLDTVVEELDDPRTPQAKASLDTIAHPYAGMKVELRIVARDALGQEGISPPVRIKLPEKIFLQPLARAAVEIRKIVLRERRPYAPVPASAKRRQPATIVAPEDILFGQGREAILTDDIDPRIERAPPAIRRAGHLLDALTMRPEDGYFADWAVFIGLKAARSALDAAHEIKETNAAADLLWHTAMRAEYGDAADARKALEQARKQLSDALQRGADPEEIAALSEAMRQATRDYLEAMKQEAMRQAGKQRQSDEDAQAKTQLSSQDIDDLLKEVQRLSEAGQNEQANQLLQRLAQILDNLEMRLASGGGGGGDDKSKKDAQLSESVDDLSQQIGKQRALRDDTQRAQDDEKQDGGKEKGGAAGGGEDKPGDLAERQKQLRQNLDEAKRGAEAGGVQSGQELSEAGKAMGEAESALRRGSLGEAQGAQERALKQMRAGADRLAQELLRRQEARNGASRSGGAKDPLGRAMDGIGGVSDNGQDVNVPTTSGPMRAREILDELRRRLEDPNRPAAERDYLRRLLERFTGS